MSSARKARRKPAAPPCPRCKSADTLPLGLYGRAIKGRFECLGCKRWFGPSNPPDAGGTGKPAAGGWSQDVENKDIGVPTSPADQRDPYDVGVILSAAVKAYCAKTGASQAAVARAAGLPAATLCNALKNRDTRPVTVRAVLIAIGWKAPPFVPAD